jgi:hypothetical protein
MPSFAGSSFLMSMDYRFLLVAAVILIVWLLPKSASRDGSGSGLGSDGGWGDGDGDGGD